METLKKIGIWNRGGKGAAYLGNDFDNADIGILDEGEGTIAQNNHFTNNNNRAGDITFKAGDGGSQGDGGDIYIGPGTYKAGDFNAQTNSSDSVRHWYQKPMGVVLLSVLAGLVLLVLQKWLGWV